MRTEKSRAHEKARWKFLYETKYLPAYLALMLVYPFWLEDLEGEIWRWIAGYEGLYQVSNYGRIKSFPRQGASTEIKIRKPILTNQGYLRIALNKNGQRKDFPIHRLVAQAFIPNPENKSEVNHKFGMKFDSYYENLEWTTPEENMKHAFKTGLVLRKSGVNHATAKLTNEQIKYIRENYIPRDPKFGAAALARKFNVGRSTILRVIHGESYSNID